MSSAQQILPADTTFVDRMHLSDFFSLSYEDQTYYIAGAMALAAYLATAQRVGISTKGYIEWALPNAGETSIQYIAKMKHLLEIGYSQFPAIKMLILRNILEGGN